MQTHTIALSTLLALVFVHIAQAQDRNCWQRHCPDDTAFVPVSSFPGVFNARFNAIALSQWARNRGMPTFEQFRAPVRWSGKVAALDLSSSTIARRYRTVIREAMREGPNFADHYVLVWWGCGSPCDGFAIVDVRTGRVYSNNEQLVLPPMYRRDSRLIVEDPTTFMTDSVGHPGFPYIHYWEWTGTQLRLLHTLATDTLPVRIQWP